jgi:hypothetical protein
MTFVSILGSPMGLEEAQAAKQRRLKGSRAIKKEFFSASATFFLQATASS